jgi:two-component system, sensor histidine kinase and response regulator
MQHKNKVLLVDDHPTNIAILEEVLSEKYHLKTAGSGEEVLELVEEFRPDVILLDIMMPGIDGYETCRRIRANPALKFIKIIMVSAKAMVAERLKGYESGADDYITKPFEEEELLAKVKVYLRLKSVEEVDQLKSNLLTLLNHETRTPLNGMLQALEILSDDAVSPDIRKICLDLLNRNTERLYLLLDKVIKLCAMKAGKWDFNFEYADLRDIINKAAGEVAARASERHVKIDQDLREAVTRVDTKEMKFVFSALLDNAIRFSPSGSRVVIGVSAENSHLNVTVNDEGAGIDPSLLGRVFEPFNESDVMHHSDGHRLSLAIARQVALAHNGTINVESRKGSGTTFTVQLPAVGT